MTVLRVCYKSGVRFDERYYVSSHLPLVGSVMAPFGVTRVEMVKVRPNPDGSAATYQVMFSAYFTSPDALQTAMQSQRMADVLGDIPKFYDGTPDVFVGEVVPLASPA